MAADFTVCFLVMFVSSRGTVLGDSPNSRAEVHFNVVRPFGLQHNRSDEARGSSRLGAGRRPRVRVHGHFCRANPLWRGPFLYDAAAHGPDFRAVGQLFLDLRAAGGIVPYAVDPLVMKKLLDANDLEGAWRYYKARNPAAVRSKIRNAAFSSMPSFITPFD